MLVATARQIRAHRPPWVPAGPRGSLDHPYDGEFVTRDGILVEGWVEYRGQPATQIQVLVDGVVAIVASPEVARPDVAQVLGLGGPARAFGWAISLDLSEHPRASASVMVKALLPNGRWWRVGRPTVRTLEGPGARASGTGGFDTPHAEEHIHGDVVMLRGWAMFGSELPARIDIAVDGISVGPARAQIPRPDVADARSTPSALASGFEHHVAVPLRPGESRTLTVTAKADHESGRTWSAPSHRVLVTARGYDPESLKRSRILRAKTIAELGTISDRDPTTLLVFTHSLAVGGGQLFLSELLRRLHQNQGIACSVVSPTDGVLRTVLEGWGITVYVVDGVPVQNVDAYEEGVRRLAVLARDVGSRVAIVNTLGVFPAADAARLAGMEVIWAIHESFDLPVFSFLNWGPAGLDPAVHDRWTASMRDVSAAVFECEATSDLFAPYIPDERRLIIPYGIAVHEIEVARRDLDRVQIRQSVGISPDALVLLAMSVYEPRKGQASLVEAFARVAPAHPQAVLVLVGEHPSRYASDVERLIVSHGLQARVIRVPIALDVYDWYAASDALVSASDVESVPRSMLEAMAFGLPVLAAGAHGIPELIRNGGNGWLFPTRDFSGLAAALERLMTSLPGERQRIAQAAHEGSSHFDADLYTADFGALIRSLVQGPRETVQNLVPERGWRPTLPLQSNDRD